MVGGASKRRGNPALISTLEQTSFAGKELKPLSPHLLARLEENEAVYFQALRAWFFARPPQYKPSEWLETAGIYLQIDATRGKSQAEKLFSFTGREYLRELIDQIEDPAMLYQTFCAGTGVGKTLRDYGILLFEMFHNPFSGLYVMPALTGSGSAAEVSREVTDTIEASPVFEPLLPKGHHARKESLTKFKMEFGGNHVAFVGGQSTSKLGGKRCRLVFIGEQDKTKEKLGPEEGADYLAGERTKGMANSKIFRGSSPSVEGRAIWKALMGSGENSGSDCRRRFLPCPHCSSLKGVEIGGADHYTEEKKEIARAANFKGWFVLIKDEQYNTALPTKLPDGTAIPFAQMKWDAEAKRKDGSWDMDRVVKSTRFECPHCGGHVRDEHRLWMDKNGVWIPTRRGEIGHAGYQLSSFYAPLLLDEYGHPSFKTTFGGMAQKFLTAIENGTVGGWVNSDLAEVNSNQAEAQKIELGSKPLAQADWIPLLTADFHKNHPLIWFVVRKWCAFKLHPPGGLTNGIPDFISVLDKPGNEVEKKVCYQLQGGTSAAWHAIGELLRFEDPRQSALIEFLLAQKIVGGSLHKIFREDGNGLAMDFRRVLYREFSMHLTGGKDPLHISAPRGGDSELIAAGYVDEHGEWAWDKLQEHIQQFEIGKGAPIPGRCVGVDCGYAAKFDRQVLRKCHESGREFKYYDPRMKHGKTVQFLRNKLAHGLIPVQRDGWYAMKGAPTLQPRGDGKMNQEIGSHVEDPFDGLYTSDGPYRVEVLDFPQARFWLHKDKLRKNLTKNTYSISPKLELFPKIYTLDGDPTGESNFKLTDYQKQMNQQYFSEKTGKVEPMAGRSGTSSRLHPYHLDDCETMNLALAHWNQYFDSNPAKT